MTIEDLIQRKIAVRLLWHWLHGGTNFASLLFGLIAKADICNLAKLSDAFPVEVQMWKEWKGAEDQNVFFRKYGMGPF